MQSEACFSKKLDNNVNIIGLLVFIPETFHVSQLKRICIKYA